MNEQLPKHFAPVELLGQPHHITQACWRYAEDYARAALAMSPKADSGTSLPPPDMTMPSIAKDGPEGAHYYRASTVRRLLENKGEQA